MPPRARPVCFGGARINKGFPCGGKNACCKDPCKSKRDPNTCYGSGKKKRSKKRGCKGGKGKLAECCTSTTTLKKKLREECAAETEQAICQRDLLDMFGMAVAQAQVENMNGIGGLPMTDNGRNFVQGMLGNFGGMQQQQGGGGMVATQTMNPQNMQFQTEMIPQVTPQFIPQQMVMPQPGLQQFNGYPQQQSQQEAYKQTQTQPQVYQQPPQPGQYPPQQPPAPQGGQQPPQPGQYPPQQPPSPQGYQQPPQNGQYSQVAPQDEFSQPPLSSQGGQSSSQQPPQNQYPPQTSQPQQPGYQNQYSYDPQQQMSNNPQTTVQQAFSPSQPQSPLFGGPQQHQTFQMEQNEQPLDQLSRIFQQNTIAALIAPTQQQPIFPFNTQRATSIVNDTDTKKQVFSRFIAQMYAAGTVSREDAEKMAGLICQRLPIQEENAEPIVLQVMQAHTQTLGGPRPPSASRPASASQGPSPQVPQSPRSPSPQVPQSPRSPSPHRQVSTSAQSATQPRQVSPSTQSTPQHRQASSSSRNDRPSNQPQMNHKGSSVSNLVASALSRVSGGVSPSARGGSGILSVAERTRASTGARVSYAATQTFVSPSGRISHDVRTYRMSDGRSSRTILSISANHNHSIQSESRGSARLSTCSKKSRCSRTSRTSARPSSCARLSTTSITYVIDNPDDGIDGYDTPPGFDGSRIGTIGSIGTSKASGNYDPNDPGSRKSSYPDDENSRKSYPNDGASRKSSPNDGDPRKGYPNDEDPRKGYPNDGDPRNEGSRKGSYPPGDGVSRKDSYPPGDGGSRKGGYPPGDGDQRNGYPSNEDGSRKGGYPPGDGDQRNGYPFNEDSSRKEGYPPGDRDGRNNYPSSNHGDPRNNDGGPPGDGYGYPPGYDPNNDPDGNNKRSPSDHRNGSPKTSPPVTPKSLGSTPTKPSRTASVNNSASPPATPKSTTGDETDELVWPEDPLRGPLDKPPRTPPSVFPPVPRTKPGKNYTSPFKFKKLKPPPPPPCDTVLHDLPDNHPLKTPYPPQYRFDNLKMRRYLEQCNFQKQICNRPQGEQCWLPPPPSLPPQARDKKSTYPPPDNCHPNALFPYGQLGMGCNMGLPTGNCYGAFDTSNNNNNIHQKHSKNDKADCYFDCGGICPMGMLGENCIPPPPPYVKLKKKKAKPDDVFFFDYITVMRDKNKPEAADQCELYKQKLLEEQRIIDEKCNTGKKGKKKKKQEGCDPNEICATPEITRFLKRPDVQVVKEQKTEVVRKHGMEGADERMVTQMEAFYTKTPDGRVTTQWKDPNANDRVTVLPVNVSPGVEQRVKAEVDASMRKKDPSHRFSDDCPQLQTEWEKEFLEFAKSCDRPKKTKKTAMPRPQLLPPRMIPCPLPDTTPIMCRVEDPNNMSGNVIQCQAIPFPMNNQRHLGTEGSCVGESPFQEPWNPYSNNNGNQSSPTPVGGEYPIPPPTSYSQQSGQVPIPPPQQYAQSSKGNFSVPPPPPQFQQAPSSVPSSQTRANGYVKYAPYQTVKGAEAAMDISQVPKRSPKDTEKKTDYPFMCEVRYHEPITGSIYGKLVTRQQPCRLVESNSVPAGHDPECPVIMETPFFNPSCRQQNDSQQDARKPQSN